MSPRARPLSEPLPREAQFAIAAAIASVSVVGIGLSLVIPLLAFRLEAMGQSPTAIGVQVAAMAATNLLVAPFIPGITRRLGVRPLLAGSLALGGACLLAHPVFPNPGAWLAIRLVLAAALVVTFSVSEFWINAVAPPARRSLVLGVYASVLSGGFAAGPVILALVGTSGSLPFVIAAGLFALAGIPLALATGEAPTAGERAGRSLRSFLLAAPAATLAGFIYGAVETGLFSFLPLYGLRRGFTEEGAAVLLTMIGLGNIALQIPIGLWADRTDRRRVLLACGVVGALGAALLPFAAGWRPGLFALLVIWGGVISGLYTVGLAHLGARFTGADLAQANAAFVMLYSLGMLLGPLAVGGAMDAFGRESLPVIMAALFALYCAVVGTRMIRAGRSSRTASP